MSGNNWPSMKFRFLDYADKCFIKEGYQTWIKCQLGHNIPANELKDKSLANWLKTQDMILFRERIQDKRTSKIGFLVGIHLSTLNVRHLELALMSFPEIIAAESDIEVRLEVPTIKKWKGKSNPMCTLLTKQLEK